MEESKKETSHKTRKRENEVASFGLKEMDSRLASK